jgi:hypothetical protein
MQRLGHAFAAKRVEALRGPLLALAQRIREGIEHL